MSKHIVRVIILSFSIFVFVLFKIQNYAIAATVCGQPPSFEIAESRKESLDGDLNVAVKALSGYAGKAEFKAQVKAKRDEILAKYPDANQASLSRFSAYMLCTALFEDKSDLSSQDKVNAIKDFRTAWQSINLSEQEPSSIAKKLLGKWRGTYLSWQGKTGLTITFKYNSAKKLVADFQFYALPSNLSISSGRYIVEVDINEVTGIVYVTNKGEWIKRPARYKFVTLTGTLNGNVFSGIVMNRERYKFELLKL